MQTLHKRVPAFVSLATGQETSCKSECVYSNERLEFDIVPKLINFANAFFAILQYITVPFVDLLQANRAYNKSIECLDPAGTWD
jgi:hypothetical protein